MEPQGLKAYKNSIKIFIGLWDAPENKTENVKLSFKLKHVYKNKLGITEFIYTQLIQRYYVKIYWNAIPGPQTGPSEKLLTAWKHTSKN